MLFHDWSHTEELKYGATADYAPKNQNLRWRLPLLAASRRRRFRQTSVRAMWPARLPVAKPLLQADKRTLNESSRKTFFVS